MISLVETDIEDGEAFVVAKALKNKLFVYRLEPLGVKTLDESLIECVSEAAVHTFKWFTATWIATSPFHSRSECSRQAVVFGEYFQQQLLHAPVSPGKF